MLSFGASGSSTLMLYSGTRQILSVSPCLERSTSQVVAWSSVPNPVQRQ